MESQHSIGAPTNRDFPRFVLISHISRPEVGSRSRCHQKRALLEKTTLCGKILKISLRNDSPSRRSTTCVQISSNLADRKSAESCVIYGAKKNKKNRLALSLSLLRNRAQNLLGPAANNVLTVPQISSKSVYFRRSYRRTREHRSNAPQSVSNTRRSFSFLTE